LTWQPNMIRLRRFAGMEEIKRLDEVLTHIRTNLEGIDTLENILTKFTLKWKMSDSRLVAAILKKLEKDEYIECLKVLNLNIVYQITFEGIVFVKKGGYVKQRRNEGLKNMTYKTNIIVLCAAAIVATIYYTHELLKKPTPQQKTPINIVIDKKVLKTDSL
ncbi:MAG TPA: hypothetical protein VF411_11830, partial [Bacteroidia bacterium]